MKRILLLLTLLLTINAKADNKSVEIEMVATAYVEPHGTDVTVDGSGVGLSGQVLRLGSTTDYEDLKGLVYFKFNNTGKAKFELLIQNGRADRQISVEFNGLKRELAIPQYKRRISMDYCIRGRRERAARLLLYDYTKYNKGKA
jgi:hypothetical protein